MAAPYCRAVQYYETDKMAIVHHSNYIRYLEEARLDYMRQAGLFYEEFEAQGMLMPVISVSCRYHTPLVFGDRLRVETHVTAFNGVRASYRYDIYRDADGALAAEAESDHCFLDARTRRPVSIKRTFPAEYERWRALIES